MSGEGEHKEDDKNEEETELYVGDSVRLTTVVSEMKSGCEKLGISWDPNMAQFAGQKGTVTKIDWKEDEEHNSFQIVHVKFGGEGDQGPVMAHAATSLEYLEEEEEDEKDDEQEQGEDVFDEEEGRSDYVFRVNEKVRNEMRTKMGKVATGIITGVKEGGPPYEVRYDDGSTESEVKAENLRPIEKIQSDGTGFQGSSGFNSFDFTSNSLPTGVEAVGEGVEITRGRGGESYLHIRKGTHLKLPLTGLRHEKLKPEEPIGNYTLTIEMQLTDSHAQLLHPWSVFQASYPEVHETDEVSIVTVRKPNYPKLKVGMDVEKLVVTASVDPTSATLVELTPGTQVQQCGDMQRLPNGVRRIPVKFKRQTGDEKKDMNFDLFDQNGGGGGGNDNDSDIDSVGRRSYGGDRDTKEEEAVLEVIAGFFGPLSDEQSATSIQIASNGISKTLSFRPGVEGGKAAVDDEEPSDIGWTPVTGAFHLMKLTLRASGSHTFMVMDSADSRKTWSKDFNAQGWWDDLYGISGIRIYDVNDTELQLGTEVVRRDGNGEHKVRVVRHGAKTFQCDDMDPQGWVNYSRSNLEQVEEEQQKVKKGPSCHVQVKGTTCPKRLNLNRWHSLTFTFNADSDVLIVYLDGVKQKEIDTWDMGGGGGGGFGGIGPSLEGGRRERGEGGALRRRGGGGGMGGMGDEFMAMAAAYGLGGWGGFGGASRRSPYAVPQEGFLLFASSNSRGMPGGIKLRKVVFRNTVLEAGVIESHYVNSRHKRRPQASRPNLVLAPVLRKKSPPIWLHFSFVGEMCNPFIKAANSQPLQMMQVFSLVLEGLVDSFKESGDWASSELSGMQRVWELFKSSEALFKKFQPLWTCTTDDVDQMSALSGAYLKRLASCRAEMSPGSRLIVPLGMKLETGNRSQLILLLEKKVSGKYRFLFICPSLVGLAYHQSSAAEHPKLKYRAALEVDEVPAEKAEDQGWWMMLITTSVQWDNDGSPLYDKLIPWLAGVPLGHLLATRQGEDGEGNFDEKNASLEWRSPQKAKTDSWRTLTFLFRILLREVVALPLERSKLVKWHFRKQLMTMAAKDLASTHHGLSVSERRLLRFSLCQLSRAAVKVSGLLQGENTKFKEPLLNEAHRFVTEMEQAIIRKPRPYGFDDPSVLPILDITSGAMEACAEEWGLYPMFDRLLREQRSPGAKLGIPLLVPIDLLSMPEKVEDLEQAFEMLRLTEELCAKLTFVGTERCKFGRFLKVALLQNVFTELLPLPVGPVAERPPISLVDNIWAPNGSDGVHPQMTRSVQFELLMLLRRLCEHFVAAICSIQSSQGFDGVKIVVLGAIAACSDRVVRTRCRRVFNHEEHAPRQSEFSDLLNGVGPTKEWRPLAVNPASFLRQSETIEVTAPELNIARTAVVSYFSGIMETFDIKKDKDETLFDWDVHGWMLWVDKEKGFARLTKALCASHLMQVGDWPAAAAGVDKYMTHAWPELECFRDIIFWWKYFLCTDLNVFPGCKDYLPSNAYLVWSVADEQNEFGSPPNRGRVFGVKALQKEHLMTTGQNWPHPANRPKPTVSGLRWPSSALASQYTKLPVRTEDDLLYMRALPTFNETLRTADSEALLSFLTVPYIRTPLVLAFFTTGDRVNCLFEPQMQQILQAVLLEPGRLLAPKRWGESPVTVPAVSPEELELIGTPYGQLLTELSCAPACICSYMAKLLELTLVLANSAMSQTVRLILFTVRLAARVESSIALLLAHADGKLQSGGPLPGALPMTPAALAELRAGRKRLRKLFVEVDGWLDTWLEELHELAQTAMAKAKDEDADEDVNDAQGMIDEYMRRCCNIHAHVLLMLRNVSESELEGIHVSRLLCSLSFLSLHHTWNAHHLDMPEPEIFEVYHHHRRGIVRWFEKQQQLREYGTFNKVLQEVHSQFSTIDSANAMDTSQFEWGVIGGDRHNAGRYCVVGPMQTEADKGDIPITKPEETSWVELNVQLMQVTVRGRHVTPLESDTSADNDFQQVMHLGGEGSQSSQTVQCAALLTTNLVHLRELLSQPYRTTRWTDMPWTSLPYLGDYDRLYDIEDMEDHEAWIKDLFEPVRQKFFTFPNVQKDILFFMREETHHNASMVVLAGVHPDCRGKIWKEVFVFKDLHMVQIFRIAGYGWQNYRVFEYTSDARYALAESQPSPGDRDEPWPDWGRHEAGMPKTKPTKSPASVVLTRVMVRDKDPNGNCGAGTRKSDPMDDPDEWSDGEPSDDETEAEVKERTVWEKSQREGEQYIPARCMSGLLPAVLLTKYRIYQENEPPCRVLRGYPLTSEGDEEEHPDHILEIKLLKVQNVPVTQTRGWCGIVRKRYHDSTKEPLYLLNLLHAREGTPLFSMSRNLSRLENLSHILAWSKSDPRAIGAKDPGIDLVELPRLMLTFVARRGADGTRRLWSIDHAELSFPIGPHTTQRSEAAKLLSAIPHAVLLQTKNEEFFALVPNVKPHRPHISTDPFSSELVLERGDKDWMENAKNCTFLYPVHASNSFLQAQTRAAALYLLMLRKLNRDYAGVAKLISAVGTDTKYEDDEMQIFDEIGANGDVHPDAFANTIKVTLAVADAGMRWPWDVPETFAHYLNKVGHVSARCRLSTPEEVRMLAICNEIRRTVEIVNDEVRELKFRFWGQWGQIKLQRYSEILSNPLDKEASFQEHKEVDSWVRALTRKLRAAQLPATKDDVRHHILEALGGYDIDKDVLLTLDNRSAYLERLLGTDGAGPEDPLLLSCSPRPKETMWQCHFDQNFLLCSLFDFSFDVLGLATMYKDAEDEEGPEIPQMRRFSMPLALNLIFNVCKGSNSLRDYGKAPQTFALFYSMFTRSLGIRLGRGRETAPSHQHTYVSLLLHLMVGGRHHGVLGSLLHILAINPKVCETMPMLSKPKKVRLVKQWKAKLTEIYTIIVNAANSMLLEWPPVEEDFLSLADPVRSTVDKARFELPPPSAGLCPRLLFCPDLPQIGAAIFGTPTLTSVTCSTRLLKGGGFTGAPGTMDLSTEKAVALASLPLEALCKEFLTDVAPADLLEETMPFNLTNHPLAKHRVAKSLFSRLDREVALCARKRNASRRPVLTSLRDEDIQKIVEGDKDKLEVARNQVRTLAQKLVQMKTEDSAFIAKTIQTMESAANDIGLDSAATDDGGREKTAKLRYWLLRYAGLETDIWFEHLCCGLLSPQCETDFQLLNPFLPKETAQNILGSVAQMMLIASRVVAICRCLDSCFDLMSILEKPESLGSAVALEAGISEKAKVLCGALSSKRTFFKTTSEASTGNFVAEFDPRFLIFEFVTGFLLRPRQVEMVSEFFGTFLRGESVVKQMIMGAGKTSVVSPMLALMLAEGTRLVCLVVPQALVMLSRSVMQNCFSTVVQKRVSTFKCDRSVDLEVNLSARINRVCAQGDIMLSTPGDVKSLQLRFLEQLGMANDRRAKKNTPQMRRECVEMGRMLSLLKRGVCMIDEVDLVLHPLKSELNFPIGQKNLIDHSPERWNLVLHLLDGFFSVDKDRIPHHLKESLRAQQILGLLRKAISHGCDLHYLQRNPHLVLLNEEFYHTQVKPIMAEWANLWLTQEHVGRVFDKGSVAGDRGLSDEEVKAYVLHRVKAIPRAECEVSLETWQGWFGSESPALEVREGEYRTCTVEVVPGVELPFGIIPKSEYLVERLAASAPGMVKLAIGETEAGASNRANRVERLAPKDLKSMNLTFDWLQVFLPYTLQKIDRVTFGIMSAEQVTAALIEQPLMPLTRAKLAIPFIGKDVPSAASEFAHPDIVIGLTVFAYRYEGLRRNDFDEVLGMLSEALEIENGAIMERPTALLWKGWVEESGALYCVKQAELDDQSATEMLNMEDKEADASPGNNAENRKQQRVLPLHLLERKNEANMSQLFELMRRLPSAVHYYLQNSIFPQFMRFQDEKLSSSGQDLGGSILFGQRIGFSGTPSDLMPKELGQCEYEPGSEGEMIRTMTDPSVVSYSAISVGWNVESLLDDVIADACKDKCSALIDTGALITGFTNREVAEYLLGFGKARRGAAGSRPALPDSVDGVVFLDEDGGKKILLKQTREAAKLADSGVPPQRRFAFYDQVHTTGMDIQHKLDAVAALTLGKDMNWRDYVQGAYRMRGIGKGQKIRLYVIPEVLELIGKDVELSGIGPKLSVGADKWSQSKTGRLLAVAAWLLVNSIRTERIQFAMLQVQNLNNIWRRNAFMKIMEDFEIVVSNELRKCVNIFKETIAFVVPGCVPRPRTVHEVVEERISAMEPYIEKEEDHTTIAEVRENVTIIAAMGDEKEGEAGLDTQQQREQEQERQQEQEQEEEKEQEIEIEKFVDMMHCRDDEEPESWDLDTLADETKAKQFNPSASFRLFKRKPLSSLCEEAKYSSNWFNPQWGGFRRVKNVFVQMEWTADCQKVVRNPSALELNEEQENEMHKKLRIVWDLLTEGGAFKPGGAEVECIDATRLRELLSASFDWDPTLHDAASALASLGKGKDSTISYEEMVSLLLDSRFRTRDQGRSFVLLSLAEAETMRRVIHSKAAKSLLEGSPNTAVALRCVFANHEILDSSLGFRPGPTYQVSLLHQLARFIDGQTFYKPKEISVLLRALQGDRPFDRVMFFEGLGGCRRRAGIANWDAQPVAEAVRPWLEFEQILARVRAIRLHDAIYSRGLSVQMAFQRFDANNSGLLEPMEFCRALRVLGFAFDVHEVANWIEAMDTNEDYCIDYPEFFAFCKQQVDALMGLGLRTAGMGTQAPSGGVEAVAQAATKRVLPVKDQEGEDEVPIPEGEVDLAHAANKELMGEDPSPKKSLAKPKLERATSAIVTPQDLEEELLRRRAIAKREQTEEARVKALEAEAIDVLIEEELGTNPAYGDGYGEWDFRGQLLPKETYALGVVDIVSESWGAGKGKNYLQLDRKAGLAVQNIRLPPNGDSDRRMNKYSLTMWFRTPTLPSKADRMLLLDLPRGEADADVLGEETEKAGAIYIWRGGVIAPDGYQEPSMRRRKKGGGLTGTSAVSGEWSLTFTNQDASMVRTTSGTEGEGASEEKAMAHALLRRKEVAMNISLDDSGKIMLKPSRGAAARRKVDKGRNFGVCLKVQHERDYHIQRRYGGNPPKDPRQYFHQLYYNHVPGSRTVSSAIDKCMNFLGYNWAALGWPAGGKSRFTNFNLHNLSKKGELVLVRNLDAKTAQKLAKDLEKYTQGGAKVVEELTYPNDIFKGDKVRIIKLSSDDYESESEYSDDDDDGSNIKVGMVGVVTDVDDSDNPYLVRFTLSNGTEDENWFYMNQVEKAEIKPLTEMQWLGLPSTLANYVHVTRKLPNPLLESSAWSGRGRAEPAKASSSEAKVSFDVNVDGGLSAYVDAEAYYSEDNGQLRLKGTWHASDGTSGPIEGVKRLAGLAVSGLWHVELQCEADSMAHAWQIWFSSFPGSDSEQGTINITGSVLAGPMLSDEDPAVAAAASKELPAPPPGTAAAAEKPAEAKAALSKEVSDSVAKPIALVGEMSAGGKVKFTFEGGDGRWAGSSWEGELGPDRMLRGSWQLAAGAGIARSTGRWRARHIGRKAVAATLRPTCEDGVKWNDKDGIVEDNEDDQKKKQLKEGSKVKLAKGYQGISDAKDGPLKPGDVGTISGVSGSMYLVSAPNGNSWYYYEAALKEVKANQDTGLENPMEDEFEGMTLTRFPVTKGTWYAEVHIAKKGDSPPVIGWGIVEKTPEGIEKLTRMALIEGQVGRKLDITEQPPGQAPPCPKDGVDEHEMELIVGQSFKCTSCGKGGSGKRWYCAKHKMDMCLTCAREKVKQLKEEAAQKAKEEKEAKEAEEKAKKEQEEAEKAEKKEAEKGDGDEDEKEKEKEDGEGEGEGKSKGDDDGKDVKPEDMVITDPNGGGEEKDEDQNGEEGTTTKKRRAKKDGEDGEGEGEEEEEEEECDDEEDEEEDHEGDEEEDEEERERSAIDKWNTSKKFGNDWEEGDIICCSIEMPGGKMVYGLNGDFSNPMGEAFNLELPEGQSLCFLVAHGTGGRAKVNIGQVGFQFPPPSAGHRGLGEAMRMRPTWQVTLPQEIKAWPVYIEPSRSSEGKKPLKNTETVELLDRVTGKDGVSWLKHEKGWSPLSTSVAGKEHQALGPVPVWKSIDRVTEVKKKKKVVKRSVQASFDVEAGEMSNWSFKGRDGAKCEEGPSMLLSTESTSSGVLRWCVKVTEGTNFQFGIVPGSQAQDSGFLHNSGECGIKSKESSGGEKLKAHALAKQFIEVICDMVEKKAKFLVGEEREHMVEVEEMTIPYEGEDVRLAITGNEGFECSLEMPILDKNVADDSSDDDDDDDFDGVSVVTCGNTVFANNWHIVTFAVDLTKGEMKVVLDGEVHLDVRDVRNLVADGPLAIDPNEGLFLFGSTRRGAGGGFLGGEADWRAGGHLRSLRLDSSALSQFDIWSQHLPKGIWRSRAGAWNSAEARICWRSRETRPKSGQRPPGDMDPRHEGLTVVTADSFRELVLESKSHVFLVATAAWCGACQDLKPRWHQLAKAMAAEPDITIAVVDMEENELPNKYFPETYIPNAKLFVAGKKRQPITMRHVGGASFEALTEFVEQHTSINIKDAVEKGYPEYCIKHGIEAFMDELREAARTRSVRRTLGRTELQGLSGVLYEFLLDTSVKPENDEADGDVVPILPPPIGLFTRSVSNTSASGMPALPSPLGASMPSGKAAPPPPPALVRVTSAPPAPGAPPALRRVVSDTAPQQQRALAPIQAVGGAAAMFAPRERLDPGLAKRLCAQLLDKQLTEVLRSAQPEDPREAAAKFFLNLAQPTYKHQTFFNARSQISWQRCPRAKTLHAAALILRFLLRWAKRRMVDLHLPIWAPGKITEMTPAALRLNWRRVEAAVGHADPQRGLVDLQLLLKRGYSVNASPFGTSPIVLAAAIGNLPAAQYLYVHGADLHMAAGRPKALPVEVAALNGHLPIVRLCVENGSVMARSLHFAAVGGALDVVKYLLSHSANVEMRVRGLPALGAALLASQHRVAEALLRHTPPAALMQPLSDEGCRAAGLADGSTLLHLAAKLGSLCEAVVNQLAQDEALAIMKNKSEERAIDLMAGSLRAFIRPEFYGCFARIAKAGAGDEEVVLRYAMADGADVSAVDTLGFSLLDVACLTGRTPLVAALLDAKATVEARGPHKPSALMWAHWSGGEDVVVQLSKIGASLSNADLEGLQRLRTAKKELDEEETANDAKSSPSKEVKKKPTSKKDVKKASSASTPAADAFLGKKVGRDEVGRILRALEEVKGMLTDAEIDKLVAAAPSEPDGKVDLGKFLDWVGGQTPRGEDVVSQLSPKLMEPDSSFIKNGNPPLKGLMLSSTSLQSRMRWGIGAEVGSAVVVAADEPEAPASNEFVAALTLCATPQAVAKAELLAVRLTSEGYGIAVSDIVALHLFVSDLDFHTALATAFVTATMPNPSQEEADRQADLDAATTQLTHAIHALPAQKAVCYRACRIPFSHLASGSLKDLLQGHRHGLDHYRPGSIVLWRHAVTATTDPALAEEIALRGQPSAGVGVVFKVRRSTSARCLKQFSNTPEHGEVAFPANSVFRVVGLFPCTARCLRRGTTGGEVNDVWSVDVGYAVQRSDALSWEEACKAQSVVVVLDEEDAGALQREDNLL